jgi:ubiquitin-activating enzyme E1
LRAYTLGIIDSEFKPEDIDAKREYIREKVGAITVPAFAPKSGLKINTDEKATTAVEHTASDDDDRRAAEIINALPAPDTVSWRMRPLSFEKDDDANFHIDYVAAASNLRATSYGIPTADRLKSKLIAGKIVPAIVTTTAAVTGLVCLELYKLFQSPAKKIEDYRNSFINLALPLFQSAEPQPPAKRKYADKEFTLWDRIEVRLGDATIQQIIDYFQSEHQLEIDMLGVGAALVYAGWMGAKAKERLPRKLTDVIQEITKAPLPAGQKHLMLEITASDADGNDIEDLPDVAYYFA